MVNDIIADSLTRIRNASMRKSSKTKLLYAKIVVSLMDVLKKYGYIEAYKIIEDDGKKAILVTLKYDDSGESVITELKRVSKPGRRVYKGYTELKRFKNGFGIIVVSTSKGVVSNVEAHKLHVGGEALCSVW